MPIRQSTQLLELIRNVKCISVDSYGSFAFKGNIPSERSDVYNDLYDERVITTVFIKVVFIAANTKEIDCKGHRKEVTTLDLAQKEVDTQFYMYTKIKWLTSNRVKIIPGVLGSCYLEPSVFSQLLIEPNRAIDDNTRYWLDAIYKTALQKGFGLHVSFMEYLDDFITFNHEDREHLTHIATIHAYILALFIITSGMSLDMHTLNIMIKLLGGVRIVDFGKVVLFCKEQDRNFVQIQFDELVDFYEKDPNKLKLLDRCFLPVIKPPSAAELKHKFKSYCEMIPHLLNDWSSTEQEKKPLLIFDLLTFIGLIDGIHKYRASATIQFGTLIKLLFRHRDNADDDDDLTYIITLRSYIGFFDSWLMGNERIKEKILEIVDVLDNLLLDKPLLVKPRLVKPRLVKFIIEEVDGGRKRYSIKNRKKLTRKRRRRRRLRISRRKH
jgi:hypothetical protein